MKKISIFLISLALFSSCQVSQNYIKTAHTLPPLEDSAPLYFYFQGETIPDTSLFIGTIDIPQPHSILYSMYSLETDAREIGGNAVMISNYSSDFDHDYLVKPSARVYLVRDFEHIDPNLKSFDEKFKDPNDPYVGIYKIEDKTGEWTKFGCQKFADSSYALTYYSSNDWWTKFHWKEGDIKARLKKSFTKGIFNTIWYGTNKSVHNNVKIKFENKVIHTLGPGVELYLNKTYPDSSSIPDNLAMGTGFAINENGYILTCYHVVKNGTKIIVKGIDGNYDQKYAAIISAYDIDNDLAILKLTDNNLKLNNIPYSFNSEDSKIGEEVYVLGYPMPETMGDNIKLTDGLVSSESGVLGDISMYQITAPIQPGNSGCPLFNKKGEVIGLVNSKIYIVADNVAYAIKTKYWAKMMSGFPEIKYQNTNPETYKGLNISDQVNKFKNYIYLIEVE